MVQPVAAVIVLGVDSIEVRRRDHGQQIGEPVHRLFQKPFPEIARIAGDMIGPSLLDVSPFDKGAACFRLLDRRGEVSGLPADLDSRLNAPEARPIVKHLGDQRVKDSGKGDLRAVDQFDAQRGGADRRQFLDQDCGISGFRFGLRHCGQGRAVTGFSCAVLASILQAGECGPILGFYITLGNLQGAVMRHGDDVSGRLNADRGTSNNAQPDRRTPGEILDTMRRSVLGVYQLGQALHDYEEGTPLRAVNEEGDIKHVSDGSAPQTVSDIYLRNEFPPAGKMKAKRPGDTPVDRYYNALNSFGAALLAIEQTFEELNSVIGDDGQPVVDVQGVESRHTDSWRKLLSRLDEEMIIWGRTFRKAYGTKAQTSTLTDDDENDEGDADPYSDADEEELVAD